MPSWYSRKLAREESRSLAIPTGAELILSRDFGYGAFTGSSVILRTAEGKEQTLWQEAEGLDLGRCSAFTQRASSQCGIAVRLLTRSLTDKGVQEGSWKQESNRMPVFPILLTGVIPLAGAVVRLLTPKLETIVISGAVLFALQIVLARVSLRVLARTTGKIGIGQAVIAAYRWTLSFVLIYAIAVLVTAAVLRR